MSDPRQAPAWRPSVSARVAFEPPKPTVNVPTINTSPTWDHEMWCAHGGHVHPVPGCPFCPEAPRG